MDGAGASAPQQGGGGGIAEALTSLDGQLFRIVSAVQKSAAPDQVKQQFSAALEAYRAGLESLVGGGGGGQPQQGVATPEQGANPNAKPMTHGGM